MQFTVVEVVKQTKKFKVTYFQAGHQVGDGVETDTFDQAIKEAEDTLTRCPQLERAYVTTSRMVVVAAGLRRRTGGTWGRERRTVGNDDPPRRQVGSGGVDKRVGGVTRRRRELREEDLRDDPKTDELPGGDNSQRPLLPVQAVGTLVQGVHRRSKCDESGGVGTTSWCVVLAPGPSRGSEAVEGSRLRVVGKWVHGVPPVSPDGTPDNQGAAW